ncbi:uncharacterized protein PHALS_08538 [Plasmopara halstedii]|uniref:Uncharacterized protein n=1 Tax=Plasmopara halstedii TaxID=4781 RepID=A0A0P1AD41_PLAHL|nr:uncharacterized protein PHALS_08538 [Plasmopara halstedii]CEG38466.1 hypothetical protein PHALS_08538 [Plasmopara halstedii]|eukprot:XP_024574835.1 hypothetical protein PHALS_08538 [Plasmopara halstedii]
MEEPTAAEKSFEDFFSGVNDVARKEVNTRAYIKGKKFDVFPTKSRIAHGLVDIVFFPLLVCVLGVFSRRLLVRVLILLANHCIDRSPSSET